MIYALTQHHHFNAWGVGKRKANKNRMKWPLVIRKCPSSAMEYKRGARGPHPSPRIWALCDLAAHTFQPNFSFLRRKTWKYSQSLPSTKQPRLQGRAAWSPKHSSLPTGLQECDFRCGTHSDPGQWLPQWLLVRLSPWLHVPAFPSPGPVVFDIFPRNSSGGSMISNSGFSHSACSSQ